MNKNNGRVDARTQKKYETHNEYGVNNNCLHPSKDTSTKYLKRKPERKSEKFLNNVDNKKA